jgi:hypothetical protein
MTGEKQEKRLVNFLKGFFQTRLQGVTKRQATDMEIKMRHNEDWIIKEYRWYSTLGIGSSIGPNRATGCPS